MSAYNILIVDDEYPARKRIGRMLEQLPDYTVCGEARNGRDGLQLYHELHPDMILTDIEMPVMNGLEMISRIREEDPRQIIIILSCYESFSYAQQAIRCNVQDYLIKDMTRDSQLKEVLDRNAGRLSDEGRGIRNLMTEPLPLAEIQGLPEQSIADIEKDIAELSLCFLSHNYAACRNLLTAFTRVKIEGFSQYCFMQYILDMIISWIGRECAQYGLSPDTVFAGCSSPLDIFSREPSIEDGMETVCGWIGRLFEAAEPVSFSPRISHIILYISDHYTEDLTLQRIADDFHISPVYLSRSFKAETGKNIITFINSIRIEKAKLLLASGHYQAREAALMVGFHNSQNFYNVFKKTEGATPAEYLSRLFPG